jgi:hypothetical protein
MTKIHLKTNSKDTHLTVTQARVLGSKLILAANNTPTPRALTPVPHSVLVAHQKAAQTAQRKAASSKLAGDMQFVGKSSFQNPMMKNTAKDLARQRAESKFKSWMRTMEGQGKSVKGTKSGKCVLGDNGEVAYVINVSLE